MATSEFSEFRGNEVIKGPTKKQLNRRINIVKPKNQLKYKAYRHKGLHQQPKVNY